MLHNKKFLYGLLGADIIGVILALLFGHNIFADNIEHIRMSWLVSQGYIPYRDFFEHHHPLIWYMFAPFMLVLPHNAVLVFYVSRILSLIASGAMLFIIYKIFTRFLQNKSVYIYFILIFLSLYPGWSSCTIFKPDTFARLFYFWGLYEFFTYIEKRRVKQLIYCGFLFAAAFLFLQTIVFSIIPLVVPLLYLWYRDHKVGKDICAATVAPLIIFAVLIAWLSHVGAWQRYFELNWIFNKHLFDILFPLEISILWYFVFYIIAAFGAFIWLLKKHLTNIYLNIIAFLFICELGQHIYFIAVYMHYLINLFIFSSLIMAIALPYINNISIKRYVGIYLIFMFGMNFFAVCYRNNISLLRELHIVNQNSTERLVHITYLVDNIYAPLYFYHTMGNDSLMIDDYLFHRYTDFDINDYIKDNAINYIIYKNSGDQKPSFNKEVSFGNSDFNINRFIVSPETKVDYIQITKNIWQRKENE